MRTSRHRQYVAPFVGAWIEIVGYTKTEINRMVAPFVGAWIEITPHHRFSAANIVAPFVGAWIEIKIIIKTRKGGYSRSLRGSVD